MTPKEVKDYGERVEAMAKKEPAYAGWGFFYYESTHTNEEINLCEMKKKLQHLKKLKFRF
jgi:thiamine monophosphate synthase